MITEAQVFLTRRCNRNCGYCNLVKDEKDLDLISWINGFQNMKRLGVQTVKIMGGEPTILPYLPMLINSIHNMGIKPALLSNSSFSNKLADELVDSHLFGYFASVDCLKHVNNSKDPVAKTHDGYKKLQYFKNKIPLTAANVVINKLNIYDVPQIVEELSNDGFHVNLSMIQTTNQKEKEFSKYDIKDEYIFHDSDIKLLTELSDILLEMKDLGYKISVPYEYIRDIPIYGIHNNWKCNDIYQLRIDFDGAMMLCNEFRTELSNTYNILNMDNEKYSQFLKDWNRIRKTIDCDGCYWSCFQHARRNIEYNRLEFSYI